MIAIGQPQTEATATMHIKNNISKNNIYTLQVKKTGVDCITWAYCLEREPKTTHTTTCKSQDKNIRETLMHTRTK